jgi:endonuclease G, mitochondrial
MPVAIPDALFKIVVKESGTKNKPDVLAFIYPQVGPGYYRGKPYDHTRYLTTVDEIEKLTGIDFLTAIPDEKEQSIESKEVRTLWPVQKEDYINACFSGGDD